MYATSYTCRSLTPKPPNALASRCFADMVRSRRLLHDEKMVQFPEYAAKIELHLDLVVSVGHSRGLRVKVNHCDCSMRNWQPRRLPALVYQSGK